MVAAMIVMVVVPLNASAAYPSNTTFYVDNGAGSGCSNSFAGTNSSQPWCDFTNVNGQTFTAGDQILLKSGDLWQQTLSPLGSGASGNPIVIGCYPSASCATNWPQVKGTTTSNDALVLTDPSYVTAQQLTLESASNGVHATFTTLDHAGLTLQSLYIQTVSTGIRIDGFNQNPQYQLPTGHSIYTGLTISHVTVTSTTSNGVLINAGQCNCQTTSGGYPNDQQNILVQNVNVTSSHGNALAIVNANNATMMDDYFDSINTDTSGTAGYLETSSNLIFNNSLFTNTVFGNANDNGVFVYDNHDTNLRWRGDYFGSNGGSAVEGSENPCFNNCTSSTNSGFEWSSNAFSGNSTSNACGPYNNGPSGYYGDLDFSYSPYAGGTAQDNLFFDTAQTCNAFIHGSASNVTKTDNVYVVASSSNLYNSGAQFGGTQGGSQWSYVSNGTTNGGSFSNMTYTSSTATWSDGAGGSITRFDLTPPTNSLDWSCRAWTAPRAGIVNVRGWILKNTTGGDGAYAAIDSPGAPSWLWNSSIGANDQTGMATNVSNYSVISGQLIRFCVNDGGFAGGTWTNTNDTVSWMGSIAYVGETPSTGVNYHLVVQTSNRCLDDSGGSTTNGTVMQQYDCQTANNNQLWSLVDQGGGYYHVVVQTSGKCLDNGGSSTNGANVTQWTCTTGNTNQNWSLVSLGGGQYQLKVQTSGKCLDNSGQLGNGVTMTQWDCLSGNTNQKWAFFRY